MRSVLLTVRSMEGLGRWLLGSATIARVVARGAFIPVFVVARKPRHELLPIRELAGTNFCQEVLCLLAAQRGCNSTVMKDLDIAVLSSSMREPKISCER